MAWGRNFESFLVRAHFDGADEYFGKLGFGRDDQIGYPYMRRDLSELTSAPGQSTARMEKADQIMEADLTQILREDMESHRDVQDVIRLNQHKFVTRIRRASTEAEQRTIHDELHSKNRPLSRREFDVRFDLMRPLIPVFDKLMAEKTSRPELP